MNVKRQLKKSQHKMLFGVCAGIAEYFGWDITLTRIIYVLATFFTAFSGLLLYIILAIVMPDNY